MSDTDDNECMGWEWRDNKFYPTYPPIAGGYLLADDLLEWMDRKAAEEPLTIRERIKIFLHDLIDRI